MVMLAVLSAACLAVEARASEYTVLSPADSGYCSLRTAITDINGADNITNTITWIYGSGGTLTLLSDLPSVNYATTWDLTHSFSTLPDPISFWLKVKLASKP